MVTPMDLGSGDIYALNVARIDFRHELRIADFRGLLRPGSTRSDNFPKEHRGNRDHEPKHDGLHGLVHRPLFRRGQIRQVPVRLLDCAEAVSHQKSLIHQKTKIIRL